MNKSKMLPVALILLGLGAASAELKLNDNLSVAGFLDMSASGKVVSAANTNPTLGASFDQFEVDFMLNFGNISGRADISQGGAGGGAGVVHLEQGNVKLTNGGFSVMAGRFLSSSGFESAEPTGLYQYSVSKTTSVYGGYQNGLALNYGTPMFGLYGAVVTDLWGSTAANTGMNDLANTPGFEGQVSVMPVEGVTAKVAYLYQMMGDFVPAKDASQQLLNVWASYAKGAITVAAEYNMMIDWNFGGPIDDNGSGWLAMGNYKFTDKIATTVRYSGIIAGDGADPDQEVTLSPSYAVSGNWLVLAEIRQNIDSEITEYAVESLFSF